MASISSLRISGVDYDIVAKSAMAAPSVELTAGTDLKIANNIISVNTDGTVGNSADMSFVAGSGTYASGVGAAAFGYGTVASGIGSHAEGEYTCVVGNYSHAEGYSALASATGSHAEGNITLAQGNNSHSEGYSTSAIGNQSHAEGENTIASGIASHSEGANTLSVGTAAHAEGAATTAYSDFSHAEGAGTRAGYYDEELFGNIYGDYSHAEGQGSQANSRCSHAEGHNTTAGLASDRFGTVGDFSHAEGYNNFAVGYGSHAEGIGTQAGDTYIDPDAPSDTLCATSGNHAEGIATSAIGNYSHSEGEFTLANGKGSHAEGTYTKSYSDNAHVANFNNIAVGEATYANNLLDNSRIINNLTSWSAAATTMPAAFSSESYFHLYNSDANTAEFAPYYGSMSVFGMNNTAMGRATMAIGNGNAAITPYSFVAGKGNYTTEYGQTVVGCWRDTSGIPSARFIVAGGSSNTSRKNLLEVADNKIYTPCDVYIGSNVSIGGSAQIGNSTLTGNELVIDFGNSANQDATVTSTKKAALVFTGKHSSTDQNVSAALGFSYFNDPKRNGVTAANIGSCQGWFNFSISDGGASGAGVMADAFSAKNVVFMDSDYWRPAVLTAANTSIALTGIDANIRNGITNVFFVSPQYSGNNTAANCSGYISWSAVTAQLASVKVAQTINFTMYNRNNSQKGYFNICISGAPTSFTSYLPAVYDCRRETSNNGRYNLLKQAYHLIHKFSLTFYSANASDFGVFIGYEY